MQEITSSAGIKNAIHLLEIEQGEKWQQMKDQFYVTYESLKPARVLKGTLQEITSSPHLVENILGAVTGLAARYLTKKLVVLASGTVVKTIGHHIAQRVQRKKELNSLKP